MKTNVSILFFHFTVFVLILLSPPPLKVEAAEPPRDKIVSRHEITVNFYNDEDVPPALPFMSITFTNISEESVQKVRKYREEINKKLREGGGVRDNRDYKKIADLIPDYVVRFTETGATNIYMSFPRKNQGIIILQKK